MRGQINKSASPTHNDEPKVEPGRPRTKEEQEITAKRLKPHSKSSTNLSRHEKPEPMTSIPDKAAKKSRPAKWQFGIRSRNSPAEAMLAIYKALLRMNAQWEVPRPKEPGAGSGSGSPDRHHRQSSQSPEYSDSDPNAGTDPEYATHSDQERRRRQRRDRDQRRRGDHDERRGRERYGRWNDYGYVVPEDPWVINARFIKTGMLESGLSTSNHSSILDLSGERQEKKTAEQPLAQSIAPKEIAKHSKQASVNSKVDPNGPLHDESVYVYVTVQLYSIEKDFYLVDFKCAGYEKLVKRFAMEVNDGKPVDVVKHHEDVDADIPDDVSVHDGVDGEKYSGEGRVADEKDITSPYPFLDVASRLIIALAEAND